MGIIFTGDSCFSNSSFFRNGGTLDRDVHFFAGLTSDDTGVKVPFITILLTSN